MKTFNTPTFAALGNLATLIQTGDQLAIERELDSMLASELFAGKGWQTNLTKLKDSISTRIPAFKIFAHKGNSKLPFVAFSSLPGVTCPGAGDCINWCYSFRAWRFPASFCRQAQNAWFLLNAPQAITQAFMSLPQNITLRLYVDGDFATGADVAYWMERLRQRPDVQAYGYSKSFNELLTYYREWPYFPNNYILNLSGGHKHSSETVEKMKALPITRGVFDAVSIGRKVKSTDHGKRETNAAIRAAVSDKVFPCPGKCGTCTPKGHACGSESFRGIRIAIAVH